MSSGKQTSEENGKGDPRLYVRVEEKTLDSWHKWAHLRRLSVTRIVQNVFRKGRFPNIVVGWEIGLLTVELIRINFAQRKIRNNLHQLVKAIESGVVVSKEGELELVQEVLERTDESIVAVGQLRSNLFVFRATFDQRRRR